jgi:hypothetical protein
MNYNNIYTSIIQRSHGRKKLRKYSEGYIYYEKHHIIPRCLGGSDNKSNLALLTAEEHWIAHLLLVKMNPGVDKLIYACQAMSMTGGNSSRTTNKMFGWIRREYASAVSRKNTGKEVSSEHREKISKALKGRPAIHQQGDNNVSKRPEVAKKISEAKKGKKFGPQSEERKKNISIALKGHRGATGDANPANRRVSCIHCKKETALPNLSKDHKKCIDKQ